MSTMDDIDFISCNKSYIPTTDQYLTALGSFGSSILIIGGLVTLGLFILFFEQVVYTNQTAHSACKRHIYWIVSVFPVMTLMSLVSLLVPRAYNVCLSVKMVYMAIGMSHFTDLTMVMFGGEDLLLERAREDVFTLHLQPLCCCCRCLPKPPVTKYSLRLVVLLTDQLPFIQSIYYVLVLILASADNITLGDVNPAGAYLWLSLVKLASVLFGVYGFMILSNFSRGYLDNFSYWKKSRSIRILILVTNLQLLAFNIMGNYGAFPCIPPYIPSPVYKQTVDNAIYLLELMILAPYTYWQYHDPRFGSPITRERLRNSSCSSSITRSSICSSTSSQDEDSKGSTASTAVTENSSGANNDLRNAINNGSPSSGGGMDDGANWMKMEKNGDAVVDRETRDTVITTQVTSILDSALNSINRGRSSDSMQGNTENGLFGNSNGASDTKTRVTSILGNDYTTNKILQGGNSNSDRLNSTRSQFFPSSDGNKETRTVHEAVNNVTVSGFTTTDGGKRMKTSKRKHGSRERDSKEHGGREYGGKDRGSREHDSIEHCCKKHSRKEKTSTIINIDGTDDKLSSKTKSRRSSSRSRSKEGSSSRTSGSSKKKGESGSKKIKSSKLSSKHKKSKNNTTFHNLNEILEDTTTGKDEETKPNPNTTTAFTPTEKYNDRTANIFSSKTTNSFSFYPGMLNRAMSLSQPNLKERGEYERLY